MKIYNDYHDADHDYWQKVYKYADVIFSVIEKSKVPMFERAIKQKLGTRFNGDLFCDALTHLCDDRISKSQVTPHRYAVIQVRRPVSVMRRDQFNYSTSSSIRPASVEARRGSF